MSKGGASLFVVTGAPGAGKTTLPPELIRLAAGQVVLDIDELLDEHGNHLGVPIATPEAAAIWPEYNRMWLRIAGFSQRAGHPVILLCPLTPDEMAVACPGSSGDVRWGLLDCSDSVRAERLRARGWDDAAIAEALADAAAYRSITATVFRTDEATPAVVAEGLLAWVSWSADQLTLAAVQARSVMSASCAGVTCFSAL
jgi:hypothetical protein